MKRAGSTITFALLCWRIRWALVLVEGNGHAFARTAESDPALQLPAFDGIGQRVCELGVIDALLGFGAEVEDIPTLRSQIAYQKFFHFIARVVAGDTDFLFHNVFVFS